MLDKNFILWQIKVGDMENYKLKVKIGEHEFEGEGREASVRRDYADFLRRLPKDEPEKTPLPSHTPPKLEQNSNIQKGQFDRISKMDNEVISLTALPQTGESAKADAALLLLLAYKNNAVNVVGTTALVKGINQSGHQVDRLDRILEPYRRDGLVIRAGKKKGTTYQLTNKGEIKAKEIMDNLLSILT